MNASLSDLGAGVRHYALGTRRSLAQMCLGDGMYLHEFTKKRMVMQDAECMQRPEVRSLEGA